MRVLSTLSVLACTSWLVLSRPQNPPRYLFTFGDSYTSTKFETNGTMPSAKNPFGNPSPPGSYCGGKQWVQHVIEASPRNTLSYNFAYSGEVVDDDLIPTPAGPMAPDFISQLDAFESLPSLKTSSNETTWTAENSVFVSWFGQNDNNLLAIEVDWGYFTLNEALSIIRQDIDVYFSQFRRLRKLGARKFMVITTPLLLRAPYYVTTAPKDQYKAMQRLLLTWNGGLRKKAERFREAYPDCQMVLLESGPIFNNVLNHPTVYGARNAVCDSHDGTSCLWWDTFHPAIAIHQAMADNIFPALKTMGFY